jgi:hypothetical protein
MSDSLPIPSPKKRRPGGQPGNSNAIKQGFYAKQFRRMEINDLEKQPFFDLQDEINMLRVFIRRVVEKSSPEAAINQDLEILRTISVAVLCINRLMRTQALSGAGSTQQELNQALQQVITELHSEGLIGPPAQPPPVV